MKKIIYVIAFFTLQLGFSQDFNGIISSYLNNNRSQLNLLTSDIENFDIKSQSYSKSMQANNVYITQQYQGIDIFNSTSSFAIKNNEVIYAKMGFTNNISSKINTTTPLITAQDAISNAASSLGLQSPTDLSLLETVSNHSFVFSNGGISLNEIPVKLVYQPTQENTLKLAWKLSIYFLDASHYYNVRIDALTGELLDSNDWVVSCNFEKNAFHNASHNHNKSSILFSETTTSEASLAGGAQYRVFAMPIESPNHGSDALIADPSDFVSSPFGWHDTDGVAGPEFTITRGNNVWAQEDRNGNNGVGASPDGGGSLTFDFPFDFNSDPVNMVDAATVNLFYWNNIMHDVWYQYGFDEENGNFQENNYGNGGNGSDSVNADAQDGSGTNNANFATPTDGSNPRMQMFLWSGGGAGPVDILTINNGPLAGVYSGVPASFGAPIPVPPLTEDIVVIEDDNAGPSTDTNDGCDNITNPGDLNGKIVIIRRGECEFGFKALGAQNEGAVAVIMVNNVSGDPIVMAPGAVGDQVTIPLFMVTNTDGDAIIAELNGGGSINGTITGENVQPDLDGDVDNAIIAHEYGHGISNRLTGGPINTNCLFNGEQMGEGWSDWFGLVLTMKTGDQPEDRRGIGTYVTGQPTDGTGIRQYPYSTNMSINPLTYANLPATGGQVHAVGTIWATMLWDLTWAFIDQYGFDPDFYNGTGGNNIAMQLVMDGMKLQGCAPGFVDGRDGILEADYIINGGANCELIWNVFANRGLGFSASQGSSNSTTDGTPAFDTPEDCSLGINDQGALNNNFNVYPNPSNGQINIASKLDLGNATINIFDINGRNIFTENVELHNMATINASILKTGVYILQINGDTYNHTTKLIIE
ncbi:MAG: T9SS-dependent M36 family metallopeptidase [Flavobacteriales bacterium]